MGALEEKIDPQSEPKRYWNEVWSVDYVEDRKKRLEDMADRANTREYWNNLWSHPKRHIEKWAAARAVHLIRKYKVKSVLDVGCGNGRLLYMVKDLDCFGIDISDVAIKRLNEFYGVPGEAMDIYDMDEKIKRKFDFIVCNHTLEHLYRDKWTVETCKKKLNKGGYFYCAVPNNMSGPEETREHVRKYDGISLALLLKDVFGNVEIDLIGNHLIGLSKND